MGLRCRSRQRQVDREQVSRQRGIDFQKKARLHRDFITAGLY
jgi:hypothetical protein